MKLGKYRHYKNKDYEVLGVAIHSETREEMVIYKPLYKIKELGEEFNNNPLFVRPKKMFLENIEVNNKMVPRFKYIGE